MKGIKEFINRKIRSKDTRTLLVDDSTNNTGLVVNRRPNGSIRNLRWQDGAEDGTQQKLNSQELLNMALEVGVKHQVTDVVEKALEKGADVNANKRDGDPIMYDAVRRPSREVVDALVVAGANMEANVPSQENATVRDMMHQYKPIPSQLERTLLGELLGSEGLGKEIISYLEPKKTPDGAILVDDDIRDQVLSFLPNQEREAYNEMHAEENRNWRRDKSAISNLDASASHSSHVKKLEQEMGRGQNIDR